ncbi:hypothetical protein [Pararhodobacter sp. SW119]|uniref:hypothetical protein n=1 Tax=Pararhodobacter sp. SW119 TaxID=2780075 RepID=UPI001ADFC2C4|nr:hypothetical protein [Pararhodobacter sp. SW119]
MTKRCVPGTYLHHVGQPSRFLENGPPKALKPVSLRNIEAHLRQFLDASVQGGRAPEEFAALADLVRLTTVREGLTQLFRQHGGRVPTSAQNISGTWTAIAKYHVKIEPEELEELRGINKHVARPTIGMTDKNISRLNQFDTHRAWSLPCRRVCRPVAGA